MDSQSQGLSERAMGWLRFVWDKATTADDWSDAGEPHPWWDRSSEPPMCAFPRFDLCDTAYALPVMIETTPAWREAYVEIVGGLLRRYTAFWGAVDWNTLIGPDPGVDRYPPEWLTLIPEKLRGCYAPPGWTGNGVEPWGLQPDPVGADGNLFYRGWLNLLLGIRRYLSGQADQDEPFSVTGYQNRQFAWTHARIAALISAQMVTRRQGPHCENTKVWPFCVSAAGLGLKLYDSLLGTTLHAPFPLWVEYARKNYMKLDPEGGLAWFAFYYDPIEQCAQTFPERVTAYSALTILQYLYPQDRDFAAQLYTLSMRALGWSDPKVPVLQIVDDPKMLATALLMARELGDATTEARLRQVVDTQFESRFFGSERDRFAFWSAKDGQWPQGQVNATLMLTECGPPGAWWRLFNEPNRTMHAEPTVRGIDYPNLGVRRAKNDMARGVLDIETTAATPSRRCTATTFTVDRLPDPGGTSIIADGEEFTRWRVTGADAIEIETDVAPHHFRIAFHPDSTSTKDRR